jgi:hypothetical protein
MSKLYTFVIPFSGTMSVWLEAESEEEARQNVMRGDWWDSNEESFESHPEKDMVLVNIEEITEGEIEE